MTNRLTVSTLACPNWPLRRIIEQSAAADKQLMTLPWANHYLMPVGHQGSVLADPRVRLIDMIVPWIEERIGQP